MKSFRHLLAFVLSLSLAASSGAEQLKEARVTQVIRDVKLLPGQAEPRPAAVNDAVRPGTAVRTGEESRTELTFADLTIARLGANTIFSFDPGTRTIDLGGGAVLVRVPKNSGGAKVSTAAVTAAITGTTMLAEYHANKVYKFVMLEGTARICRVREGENISASKRVEECVDLGPGQMLAGIPGEPLGEPVAVDLKALVASSKLLEDFGPLGSEDLIQQEIQAQENAASPPQPIAYNQDPTQQNDAVDQRIAAEPSASPSPSPSPSATPAPTPSEFGPPVVITSSNPYVIDATTAIQTDPTITTGGVIDFGKIYRGPSIDGPASSYFFGSTSSFDTASGFDVQIDSPGAVFKFLALVLAGNPAVSTVGGQNVLALISVGDITSNAPGGALTFAGLEGLLFATQNGSINLGSAISFAGLRDLTFYARGAGSNLSLGSAISTSESLHLYSQGAVLINGAISSGNFTSYSGGDFVTGSNGSVTAGGISVTSLGNIAFEANRFSAGAFSNISLSLNASGMLTVDARNGQAIFNNAGLVNLNGDTITFLADNPFTITFTLNGPSTITAGSGGINASSIDFLTSGLTPLNFISAGSITAHSIGTSGLVVGTVAANGGSLTLTGTTSTFYTLISGEVSALTSINIGGNAIVVNMTAGTTIDVNGLLSAFGAITAGGNITATTLDVSEGGVTTTGSVIVGAGGIRPFVVGPGGAAKESFITADTIVSPNGIDFSGNQFDGIDGLSSGGRLTLNARTLLFDSNGGIGDVNFDGADVNGFPNGGPSAAGNGGIFIANATGDITVNSVIEATSGLQDASSAPTGNGGTVTLHSTGGRVSVNSLIEVSANDNSGPAMVHRSASGGNITVQSDLSDGTAISIGSSAQLLSLLNANAAGPGGMIILRATGASSTVEIDNSNGSIVADRGLVDIRNLGDGGGINLTNANIFADVIKIGALGANGALTITGGTISADTILRLYAGGSNGSIIFAGNVTLSSQSTATLIAANSVTILNGFVVMIGGPDPAFVFTNFANYMGSGGNNSTLSKSCVMNF